MKPVYNTGVREVFDDRHYDAPECTAETDSVVRGIAKILSDDQKTELFACSCKCVHHCSCDCDHCSWKAW